MEFDDYVQFTYQHDGSLRQSTFEALSEDLGFDSTEVLTALSRIYRMED